VAPSFLRNTENYNGKSSELRIVDTYPLTAFFGVELSNLGFSCKYRYVEQHPAISCPS
jgi:hypothetical protein